MHNLTTCAVNIPTDVDTPVDMNFNVFFILILNIFINVLVIRSVIGCLKSGVRNKKYLQSTKDPVQLLSDGSHDQIENYIIKQKVSLDKKIREDEKATKNTASVRQYGTRRRRVKISSQMSTVSNLLIEHMI